MIGYHYTAAHNWPGIERKGLQPYTMREEIAVYILSGVLIWPEPHELESDIGSVLWQVQTKRTYDVALLAVDYNQEMLAHSALLGPGDTLNLLHDGHYADGSPFHEKKPFLVLCAVPPENITLLASYHVPYEVQREEGL